MRNVNQELAKHDYRKGAITDTELNQQLANIRKNQSAETKKWHKIAKMKYPVVYDPESGKRIYHDLSMIQQHFMKENNFDGDQKLAKEKSYRFRPAKINRDPLNLNTILG